MNKPEIKKKLDELVPLYKHNKTEMDSYKKLADKFNKEIKEIMINNKITEHSVGDVTVTCTTSESSDFNEELLIAKIKELGVKGIIKRKECVDMDALESAIYNGTIPAIELASCQVTKQTTTLRIKK